MDDAEKGFHINKLACERVTNIRFSEFRRFPLPLSRSWSLVLLLSPVQNTNSFQRNSSHIPGKESFFRLAKGSLLKGALFNWPTFLLLIKPVVCRAINL
jgi:hypothetical protein